MNCRDLQFELPVYFDDIHSAEERFAIDEHLAACPLCRQRLDDLHSVRNQIRALNRLEPAAALVGAIRGAVAGRLGTHVYGPDFRLVETRRNWIEVWLMPYAVGTVTTIVLGFTLLWVLLLGADGPELIANSGATRPQVSTPILLTGVDQYALDLSPVDYANSRLAIAAESPSINPRGALVALTKSLIRGKMKDEEVVVVADVFGNGLAQIAEVVEPTHDRQTILALQKALQTDPDFAPFVPAKFDRRSETMRVVLRIQSVNVSTSN